jgi:hypothetical protein
VVVAKLLLSPLISSPASFLLYLMFKRTENGIAYAGLPESQHNQTGRVGNAALERGHWAVRAHERLSAQHIEGFVRSLGVGLRWR